jgi:4-amino-4-deoxy-L-arabinose transferase-like glycosyltransferase
MGDPLAARGRWPLWAACLGLNAIVILNAYLHDPSVGYDGRQHLKYFATLSEGRLPLAADSREFFCPPLPYLVPALAMRLLHLSPLGAGKWAQAANALLSLGITWLLVGLCEDLAPGDETLKLGSVLMLVLLTVYYKTMSFVRGEPYVAFWTLVSLRLAARSLLRSRPGGAVGLGLALGLLLLSRQLGFLVLPALVLFAAALSWSERRWAPLASLLPAVALGVVLAAPFYAHLSSREGSPLAFNRPRGAFSLWSQDRNFYLGLGEGQLFRSPIRPAFPNELGPIFYSEIWGDYWEFFTVYVRKGGVFLAGRDLDTPPTGDVETNRREMAPYLGRVNAVSLLPSAALLGGLLLGLQAVLRLPTRSPGTVLGGTALVALVVLCSLLGYMAVLLEFPEREQGNFIKATYVLHIFPLLSVLAAQFLLRLPLRRGVLLAAWALVFAHNVGAMVTRHF